MDGLFCAARWRAPVHPKGIIGEHVLWGKDAPAWHKVKIPINRSILNTVQQIHYLHLKHLREINHRNGLGGGGEQPPTTQKHWLRWSSLDCWQESRKWAWCQREREKKNISPVVLYCEIKANAFVVVAVFFKKISYSVGQTWNFNSKQKKKKKDPLPLHRSDNLQSLHHQKLRFLFLPVHFFKFMGFSRLTFSRQKVSRGDRGGWRGQANQGQTRLYSFKLSCKMVSLTAAKTNRIFSVSVAHVKWE